jgi:hypothetical protein
MGMHEGFLVAAVEWPDLLKMLEKHCGELRDQGPVAPQEWLNLPEGVDAFHVASGGGSSYLLDSAMVLTSNPDLVVSLSSELGCKVASAGAETVSGTFWLVAADSGRLLRLHWNQLSGVTLPLDVGDPLASESRAPLEEIDGKGLVAAIAELGFDPRPVIYPTPGEKFLWAAEKLPASGDLEAQISAHSARYKRPGGDDWTKHIKPVQRADGGFDLQYQPATEKPNMLRRLFGK